jgi:hypothetical protein
MNLNQQPCSGVECKGCKTGTLVETDRAELRRRKQGCCLGRTNTACKMTVSIEHKAQDSSKASVRLAPKPCPARDIQAGDQANHGGERCSFQAAVHCCQYQNQATLPSVFVWLWHQSELRRLAGPNRKVGPSQATTKQHSTLHSVRQEPRQGTSPAARQQIYLPGHAAPPRPTNNNTETARVPGRGRGPSHICSWTARRHNRPSHTATTWQAMIAGG